MLDQIYCWHPDLLMRVLFTHSKEYSGSQKYTHKTETTWAINHEQTVKGGKDFLIQLFRRNHIAFLKTIFYLSRNYYSCYCHK